MQQSTPDYFQFTPIGVAKLLAVWDELSLKEKVDYFGLWDKAERPLSVLRKPLEKALSDQNEYIRYLSAKRINECLSDEEEPEIFSRIRNDKSNLVRLCHLEDRSIWPGNFDGSAEEFFDLPGDERLWTIINVSGEKFAEIFSHGVKLESSSVLENADLVNLSIEYLHSDSFENQFLRGRQLSDNGFLEYSIGKHLAALWELTFSLPNKWKYPFVSRLPLSLGLHTVEEEDLERLPTYCIQALLLRSDVQLQSFRKKIFFDLSRESLHFAAVSNHFRLSDEEFAKLIPSVRNIKKKDETAVKVTEEDKGCVEQLACLASFCESLEWVQFQAIKDILRSCSSEFYGWPNTSTSEISEKLERHIENKARLRGDHAVRQDALRVRLYTLAEAAVPWDENEKASPERIYSDNGELDFLKEKVVEGDTWLTYRNFFRAWDSKFAKDSIEPLLPRIWEFDPDDEVMEDSKFELQVAEVVETVDGMKIDLSALFKRLERIESSITSTNRDTKDLSKRSLSQQIDELGKHDVSLLERIINLTQINIRQSYLLWGVATILVLALIFK